jgi:hypothetical protein
VLPTSYALTMSSTPSYVEVERAVCEYRCGVRAPHMGRSSRAGGRGVEVHGVRQFENGQSATGHSASRSLRTSTLCGRWTGARPSPSFGDLLDERLYQLMRQEQFAYALVYALRLCASPMRSRDTGSQRRSTPGRSRVAEDKRRSPTFSVSSSTVSARRISPPSLGEVAP